MKLNRGLPVLAVAATLTLPVAIADTSGRHPLYVRARSDLRTAQRILRVGGEGSVNIHQDRAAREVEFAIREMNDAAVVDREDVSEHPPADTGLDRTGRLRKVLELLQSARRDIGREEDNTAASRWRSVAYRHIDAAINSVKRAAYGLRINGELGF